MNENEVKQIVKQVHKYFVVQQIFWLPVKIHDVCLSGSSIHGILQAGILEWIAISFSRGSSQPKDWTWVSRIVGRCFTIWAAREVHAMSVTYHK